MSSEFTEFPKMGRLSRDCVVTEKLDGTNGQILIVDVLNNVDYSKALYNNGAIAVLAGSRSRWVTPGDDNYGFARWVADHAEELVAGLGVGRHFGEWWGAGIRRRYDQAQKNFSLFNVGRWYDSDSADKGEDLTNRTSVPACCRVVPILLAGPFRTDVIDECLRLLGQHGSLAAPGFMDPEGVIVYHTAAKVSFKKTLKDDGLPKSSVRK